MRKRGPPSGCVFSLKIIALLRSTSKKSQGGSFFLFVKNLLFEPASDLHHVGQLPKERFGFLAQLPGGPVESIATTGALIERVWIQKVFHRRSPVTLSRGKK